MATIGSFKKSGNEFQGTIVTMCVQTKGVRIVPETNRANGAAPSHRIYVGRAEIGAAWSKSFDPVTAQRVRLNVLESTDGPTIWEFQLFK